MGTWDRKNFGNDDALDFVSAIENRGTSEIEAIIKKVAELSPNTYLEASECQSALAAIEVLAFLNKKPASDFPKELERTLSLGDPKSLTAFALKAIERIKTSSELKDLWAESPEYKNWIAVLDDLEKRIS